MIKKKIEKCILLHFRPYNFTTYFKSKVEQKLQTCLYRNCDFVFTNLLKNRECSSPPCPVHERTFADVFCTVTLHVHGHTAWPCRTLAKKNLSMAWRMLVEETCLYMYVRTMRFFAMLFTMWLIVLHFTISYIISCFFYIAEFSLLLS